MNKSINVVHFVVILCYMLFVFETSEFVLFLMIKISFNEHSSTFKVDIMLQSVCLVIV